MNSKKIHKFRNILFFTLIELLLVIAIIAILMSILLPALKKVKDHTNTAKCASNLKQLGVGTHNYFLDNSDRIPFFYDTDDNSYCNANAPGWFSLISQYVNVENDPTAPWYRFVDQHGPNVFTCPTGNFTYPTKYAVSYAPDINTANGAPQDGIVRNGTINMVKSPSRKLWLLDSKERRFFNFTRFADDMATSSFVTTHNGSCNNLYFDGHTRWRSVINMLSDAKAAKNGDYSTLFIPYKL